MSGETSNLIEVILDKFNDLIGIRNELDEMTMRNFLTDRIESFERDCILQTKALVKEAVDNVIV